MQRESFFTESLIFDAYVLLSLSRELFVLN